MAVVTLTAYEDITDKLAARLAGELDAADGDDVTLRVCSGGGSVFAGQAIVARLRDYPGRVTVVVDGLAASAASFIAVGGGDEVVMSEGSEMMIHEAAQFADGFASDLRKSADDLDRASRGIAEVYARKAGGTAEDWLGVMADERWYTAAEAVEAGLADRVAADPVPVGAVGAMNRIVAQHDHRRRGGPPAVDEKETEMSMAALARELGTSEDKLREALLASVRNETVEVSGEVEVTYPEGVQIAPTERITVEPIIGDGAEEPETPDAPEVSEGDPVPPGPVNEAPAGLAFEMGTVADGFTAEVDAESGVVTVTAPAGAEPGTDAEFTVKVNGAEVPLTITVRSLSEEPEETAEPEVENTAHVVTLDRETYDLLVKQAKAGAAAAEAKERDARVAEVDRWISEGRVAAAQRATILDVMDESPRLARKIYGNNPANTVPVAEAGHVGEGLPKNKADEMRARANARRAARRNHNQKDE